MSPDGERTLRTADGRAHARVASSGSVVVTVLSSPDVPELRNKVFFCSTRDLSVGGLRLRMQVPVPPASILGLLVAMSDPIGAFRHIGRVAWTRRLPEGAAFAVGVEFTDTPRATRMAWRDAVGRRLRGPAAPVEQGNGTFAGGRGGTGAAGYPSAGADSFSDRKS